MKALILTIGLLTLALQSFLGAQSSTSAPIGFHSELVKADSFSLIGVNVTNNANEPHHRSIEEMFGPNNETGLNAGSQRKLISFGFQTLTVVMLKYITMTNFKHSPL